MAWRVRLSDDDLAMLQDVTSRRCYTKSVRAVDTQKFDRTRTDFEIAYFGFMGEVGFARAFCMEPDWSVLVGGDVGYDISVGGNTIQVKTPISKATRDWFYFNDEERFSAKYGVLCNVDDYETSVIIRGAISKEDFIAECVTKDFGYGERVAVNASQLSPMDSLIEAVQSANEKNVGEKC